MMDGWYRDFILAMRMMRKNPAFAATAVLTLALGIGGNTAVFTVVRAVLLKPLEYQDPDRLVRISEDDPRQNYRDAGFSQMRFDEMKASARSFTELGAFFIATESLPLSGGAEPEVLKAARVSANFLHILGIAPALGRGFLPEEDTPGAQPVAMISSELWQRRFGGDPFVAGKTALLDSIPYTIVGVLPARFYFPYPGLDVWITHPADVSATPLQDRRTATILIALGRLKPGVSLEQARAEAAVLNRQFAFAHPGMRDTHSSNTIRVTELKEQLEANVRPILWMLFGAVGLVLLIACANVASLLLARAASRSREFAIRGALGAGRVRLIRQLVTESLLFAVAGGAVGVVLAKWSLDTLTRTHMMPLPRTGEVRLDGLVLGFTAALSIATGVLFGLFPSLGASRPNLAEVLREHSAASGRASAWRNVFGVSTRGLLVVGQIALSVVLVIGAALLLQSLARLHGVDPGFQPANLLTMQIALPPARYDTNHKKEAFFNELVRRVEGLPGVRHATVALALPTGIPYATVAAIAEQPAVIFRDRPVVQFRRIMPAYFQTLQIPLRRGRAFTERDIAEAPPVTVINESFARRFWPAYPSGENPIGQHVLIRDTRTGGLEVVGVVADIHESGPARNSGPELYLPFPYLVPQTAALAVRTDGDPRRFVNAVRGQVLAIDRDQPVSAIRTMDDLLEASVGPQRFVTLLLGSFAGVALMLAVIGIYGVIAYSVSQRTQELGIRRALGAQSGDLMRLVVGQGLVLSMVGIAIGIAGAVALTRVIKGLLFHVSATDPATFVGIALLFVAVALAASYIPARRATRIDPMAAIR